MLFWSMFFAEESIRFATARSVFEEPDKRASKYIMVFKGIWVFPKIGVPQNGRFIMEKPIKMDDLEVPLFSETLKRSAHNLTYAHGAPT